MKAGQINNLSGSYGTIKHEYIWHLVEKYRLDMLVVTLMQYVGGQFVYDPQACAPETREYVLGKGIQFGFSRAYNWLPQNEVQYADQLNLDLNMFGLDNKRHPAADPCYVFANAELHTFDVEAFLAEYRKKRPTRATGWTIEGMQGGRIPTSAVARINGDWNFTVFGEAYTGPVGARPDMYPVAADAVKDDLRSRGLQRVKVVYSFKEGAPDYMDGCGYVLEYLPL